jgi:uncharacterized protein
MTDKPNPSESRDRPLAAVTGASSGIGLELARALARHGYDLIMSAEDLELDRAATTIENQGARVHTVRADLRQATGVDELYAAIVADGRPLDVIALNAGVGKGGPFVENDVADELPVIELNIISTVRLAKLVLRDMVANDSGRVLFTSSIA